MKYTAWLAWKRRYPRYNSNKMFRRVCRSSVAPAAFSRLASEKVQGEVIGIDLGTTYSRVAVMEGDKPRKTGIHLVKDKMPLQRVREAAEKAKCELSSAMRTEVNLPFISANSEGPQHIHMTLSRSKVEGTCDSLIQRIIARSRRAHCTLPPCKQCLKDSGLEAKELHEVVLVGGMKADVKSEAAMKTATAALAAGFAAVKVSPRWSRLSAAGVKQPEELLAQLEAGAVARWSLALLSHQTAVMDGMSQQVTAAVAVLNATTFTTTQQVTSAATTLEEKVAALAANPSLTGAQAAKWAAQANVGTVAPAKAAWTAAVQRHETEQRRIYESSVVSNEKQKNVREVSRKSDPLYRDKARSKQVCRNRFLGTKQTVHYTERVHYANKLIVTKVQEHRDKVTYGSGTVTYGDWVVTKQWEESTIL
jgi:hypothetical protein